MESVYLWILTISVSPLLFGCWNKHQPERDAAPKKGPIRLSEIIDLETEVFPLPNGNAYLINNIDQQMFLLSEEKAKRIDNVELSGIEATVYTLPNGRAYLTSSDGQHLRLYYLVGDKATLVQEGAITDEAMQRDEKASAAYLWSQTQSALLGKRRAISNSNQPTPPEDDR